MVVAHEKVRVVLESQDGDGWDDLFAPSDFPVAHAKYLSAEFFVKGVPEHEAEVRARHVPPRARAATPHRVPAAASPHRAPASRSTACCPSRAHTPVAASAPRSAPEAAVHRGAGAAALVDGLL